MKAYIQRLWHCCKQREKAAHDINTSTIANQEQPKNDTGRGKWKVSDRCFHQSDNNISSSWFCSVMPKLWGLQLANNGHTQTGVRSEIRLKEGKLRMCFYHRNIITVKHNLKHREFEKRWFWVWHILGGWVTSNVKSLKSCFVFWVEATQLMKEWEDWFSDGEDTIFSMCVVKQLCITKCSTSESYRGLCFSYCFPWTFGLTILDIKTQC